MEVKVERVQPPPVGVVTISLSLEEGTLLRKFFGRLSQNKTKDIMAPMYLDSLGVKVHDLTADIYDRLDKLNI